MRRITNRAREPLALVLVTSNTMAIDNAIKPSFFNIKMVCSLTGIKVKQPHKKTYLVNASIANFNVRPKTASSERASLSAWATPALRRAHATKKQTGHPPMFFANHLAIRPTA
ncbi:hypothetical protein EVAR_54837_1 [Eumeta japonica]|uniref:Uncharacterized protein n=1 Tax=Eumeta variegata TaxID=151549 RepID=A0A4C1ZBR3_EUMVA|nr:hypothetical protein EVAR_54837_1 [Eumeta japonica]